MAAVAIIFFLLYLTITILFLLAQSSFAKAMPTSHGLNNTHPAWIWTQLIPIWSLVAIPVTLVKLNTQFQTFITEKQLSFNHVKMYNNTWGWIWYGGVVASIFIPILGIIALVGVIGFWLHINGVKKSLIAMQAINTDI